MINTLYINILQSRQKPLIQEFCDSFGDDGYWVTDTIYRMDVSEDGRIQFKMSLSSFEADLGSNICAVSGVKDDELMLVALECATRYALGKMVDLSDVMLMCVWDKEPSLLNATSAKLKDLSAEILDTIRMYFYTSQNAVLAAKQLYLHRNTFNYRLDKFSEKTNMDIRNPHIAQYLYQYFILIERI